MIGLVYRDSLPQGTADEFDQLVQGLTGMLYREHDPDGTHTDITADSLLLNPPSLTNGVAGTIIFQDRLGNKTVVGRSDTAGSTITLYASGAGASTDTNGQTVLFRWIDDQGIVYDMVRIGHIAWGTGEGFGIEMLPRVDGLPNVFHDWAMVSGTSDALPGARMLLVDKTLNLSPVSLRYRNSGTTFEFMKTTGTSGPSIEPVNLGSGFDSAQAGYWDNLYVKSITLGNTAGPTGGTIGTWIDVPFSAGNFTAGGAQTWTVASGDQAQYQYMLMGNTMMMNFIINTTTVGGTPDAALRLAIPGGFTVASGKAFTNPGYALDNGVVDPLRITALSGTAYLTLLRQSGLNWSASTDNTYVQGQISFAIA